LGLRAPPAAQGGRPPLGSPHEIACRPRLLRARYSNAKADAAIEKGSLEFDAARRAGYFTEAMLAVDADAGFIPLVTRKIAWAMRKGVHVKARPNDILDVWRVKLD